MTTVDEVLSHYGIPGMKWGVRRARSSTTGRVISEDAAKAAAYKKQARKSGVSSLDNEQLKELNRRLELESKYNAWARANPTMKKKAIDFVTDLLIEEGKSQLGFGERGKDGKQKQSDLSQIADVFKKVFAQKTKVTVVNPPAPPRRKSGKKRAGSDPVFNITDLDDRRLPARRR